MRRTRRGSRDGFGPDQNGWEEQGGYMNAKIRKLESQFAEEPKKSAIFSGIRVYVNGYTEPPALEIRRLVQEHGGTYTQYYSQSAGDFMVAANLPLAKIKKINNQKIVKASWITDSIASGRLLPWKNFQLYPPHNQLKNQRALTSLMETKSCSPETTIASDEQSRPSHVASENITNEISAFSQVVDEPLDLNASMAGQTFSPIENTTLNESVGEQNEYLDSQTDRAPSILPTTSDDYIRQYYSRSRLHHLSKWAADLRDLVRTLRQKHEEKKAGVEQGEFFRAEVERIRSKSLSDSSTEMILERVGAPFSSTRTTPSILMHIDMDCFFVSVCLRSRPEFVGLPVAVTHSKGKLDSSMAEVASCSYEARKFGVKNGMLLGKARALCPELKVVPYEFDAFFSVAEDLYKTVARFCLQIEAVSCDEMFVDVTNLLEVRSTSEDSVQLINPFVLGAVLRRQVKEATRCAATCGFGTNRLLARLATKRAKPDAQALLLGPEWKCVQSSFELEGERTRIIELASLEGREYLEDLPLAHLPGVGRQMVSRIAETYGISTCGELLKTATHGQLSSLLGVKTSQKILQLCQGVDSTELTLDRYAKSISAEINYGVRLSSWPEVEKFVKDLAKELSSRLYKAASESRTGFGMVGKNLVVHLLTRRADQPVETAKYLGHGICDNVTRTVPLSKATADAWIIAEKCLSILRRLKPNPEDIRGLGLQMQRLSPSSPLHNKSKLKKDAKVGGISSITRFLKSSSDPSNQKKGSNDNSVASESANESSSISDVDDIMSSSSEESNQLTGSGPTSLDSQLRTPERQFEPSVASTSTPAPIKETKVVTPQIDSTEILPHQPNRPIEEVNVFARRSVEELQNMFATWITTESDPLEEDLCMLADYLISILPTDLARVRCLLRGLLRLMGGDGVAGDGVAWKHAFKRLRVTIDAACRRHYDVESLDLDST
ncbi:unnamed protein product [Hymenolepis diminuta]|uniref:DNA repair protein REV1 n=2 Tax=Hymenolepis diminuta TaxID=6216 RepID=A0A564Z5J5_HYMDI|nr:unnamed protein product [Hymenolepis diminuta]